MVFHLEMVVPEVDKNLLQELEGMGFSTERATRALHYSGELKKKKKYGFLLSYMSTNFSLIVLKLLSFFVLFCFCAFGGFVLFLSFYGLHVAVV